MLSPFSKDRLLILIFVELWERAVIEQLDELVDGLGQLELYTLLAPADGHVRLRDDGSEPGLGQVASDRAFTHALTPASYPLRPQLAHHDLHRGAQGGQALQDEIMELLVH